MIYMEVDIAQEKWDTCYCNKKKGHMHGITGWGDVYRLICGNDTYTVSETCFRIAFLPLSSSIIMLPQPEGTLHYRTIAFNFTDHCMKNEDLLVHLQTNCTL